MSDIRVQQEQSSLFWWNFPILKDRLSETDGGFTKEIKFYLDHGDLERNSPSKDHKSNPTMVYFLNTRIQELDLINHNEYEQEVINRQGLDFYLWEPLCYAHTENTSEPEWFFHGIWNCGFYAEMHNSHTTNIICMELASIHEYATRNNLTNVTVHTCDYNVETVTELYSDRLNIICNDVFLKYKIRNQGLWPENLSGKDNSQEDFKNISKTFLSTTWRFTPSRWLVNCALSKYNTDLVWAYKTMPDFDDMLSQSSWIAPHVLEHYPRDYYNDLLTGSRRLNLQTPLSLDIKIHRPTEITELRGDAWPKYTANYDNANPSFNNFVNFPLRKYYSRCFVDVVAETRYAQTTSNVSEKILQTIMFRTPFIMVAPPYSLEYMRELGFKTFHDFWDESYDTEPDHAMRFFKLYELFEYLDSLENSELQAMYSDMTEILDHNHDHFLRQTSVHALKQHEIKNINRNEHTEIQWNNLNELS